MRISVNWLNDWLRKPAAARDLANPAGYIEAVLGGDHAAPDDRRSLR